MATQFSHWLSKAEKEIADLKETLYAVRASTWNDAEDAAICTIAYNAALLEREIHKAISQAKKDGH